MSFPPRSMQQCCFEVFSCLDNIPRTESSKIVLLTPYYGTPLQYSCLEHPEEPGGLQSMGLLRVGHDDFTFTFHLHALEKEMATHSSILAWRIPGTGELGGLLSLGSHRVKHD